MPHSMKMAPRKESKQQFTRRSQPVDEDLPGGRGGAAEIEDWLAFKQARAKLDERSQEIIDLKRQGHTNTVIGHRIGLTPQRVGQLLKEATTHMGELLTTRNRAVYDLSRWPKRANQSRDWRRDDDWVGMEYLSLGGIVLHELASVPEPDRTTALENLKPIFQIKKLGHIWPHFAAAVQAVAKGERYSPIQRDAAGTEDTEDAA